LSNFAILVSIPDRRSIFVKSLIADLGLGGLDINWEYPTNEAQTMNMVRLLQAARDALNIYGLSLEVPYYLQVSVAAPRGAFNNQKLHLSDMDQYIDFWNLMACDYAGS